MRRVWRSIAVVLVVALGALGAVGTGEPAAAGPALSDARWYSPGATEGSIYRLYGAYFLREPDGPGFLYWYQQARGGASLDAISERFAASSEFRSRYGALDDTAFVELIYTNVIGRAADPDGRDYWVGRLQDGLSRGRVMRFFSEAGEYRRATVTGVPAGWRAGANARQVLAALPVAAEHARTGYRQDLFDHWDDVDEDGCTTRCEVMGRERRSDGTWFSWWDGKLVDVSGHMDIDHVVALAEAWDSGAWNWTAGRRDAFADWQLNLLAVGQTINGVKGGGDAADWTPPLARSRCLFAEITVTTKARWGLSVDAAEKAALGDLLARCGRTSSDPPAVTGPPAPRRTAILYGDSLSMESAGHFTYFVRQGGYSGLGRVWGGTAPCDWYGQMRKDAQTYRPAVVVLQFSGAALTQCMQNRDYFGAYRADTRTVTRIFADAGVPVVWVSTPLPERAEAQAVQRQLNLIEEEAAVELGQTYVDAGAAVLDDGEYSQTLPCLRHETAALGCRNGRIIVRSPDRAHLCPTQENFPCPLYSSGAYRYGSAQADAALRRLGAKP